ncbi:MAG: 5-(carboxyamino)imidazole ribonucleotide synthase [Verrucomicrobiales bacterium]|nr:5-(carboxyamino)imidazole ribonucleotide synthase [Verrucomicrobiales bacterium]
MNPGDGTWIGVLGGGQLGRMLALEARRMGFKVLKWTGGDTSGAAHTADLVFEEPFDDENALSRFCEQVDVATVEFENVPRGLLEEVESRMPLMPGSKVVATCQHREREKKFLSSNGFPCAGFELVTDADQLTKFMGGMPTGVVLKTAEFGYDGKGQRMISGETDAAELGEIWETFDCDRAVVEEKIDLVAELSVIVARSGSGEVVCFDAAENQHRNHILDVSIVPARLDDDLLRQAGEMAVEVAAALDYIGVLGVEFFVSGDGRLLINELAPRPHNSGHHTLDACATSQFEQQARAITGLPLGSPQLVRPAVMLNLLGDLWPDPTTPPDWTPVLKTPGAALHLYGKSEARPGRKMGHVTFTASTRDEALRMAAKCREQFGLPSILS